MLCIENVKPGPKSKNAGLGLKAEGTKNPKVENGLKLEGLTTGSPVKMSTWRTTLLKVEGVTCVTTTPFYSIR